MVTKAVQAGLSQFIPLENDISYGLLVVGVGVFTYEIVSKTVHEIASEALPKTLYALAMSTGVMLSATKLELPKLQGGFVFLCLFYVAVSIRANNPKKITASSLPGYMVNMVAEARKGAFLSKIGYEKAVRKVEVLMNKKTKPNAILLAPVGVGKSTIPETIAYKIANRQYSKRSVFYDAKLIQVDFTALLAGTKYRGSLEARVKEMVQLAKTDRKVIYFIDEIHKLAGVVKTNDSIVDVSGMLLTYMARGDIRILGASTLEDYKPLIKSNPAFARRLPEVTMEEPLPPQCFQMLQHSFGQISLQGRIKISNRAIAAAILFSKDIPERYFPDKAVDFIEDAISQAESELDDTENDVILTEYHIAAASCSLFKRLNVDSLVQKFTQFISEQPDYFPGLVGVVDEYA